MTSHSLFGIPTKSSKTLMLRPCFLLLLTGLFPVWSLISSNDVLTAETMTDAQKGESLRHFARELNRLLQQQNNDNNNKATRSHRRSLQQDPVFEKDPPKRTCGQVIGVASREEVLNLVDGIWSIVNPTDNLLASVTSTSILYGLQARVVCGSCAQVYQTYAGAPFLSAANSTQSNAFARFCGPTRFAHNTTFSSLVLTPINATTQEPLHARLKVNEMQTKVLPRCVLSHVCEFLQPATTTTTHTSLFWRELASTTQCKR